MTGDNDDSEDQKQRIVPDLTAQNIYHSRHQINCKRTSLDILSLAHKLQNISERDEVCDEQGHEIMDAVLEMIDAADSVWPGDGSVPDLDELAEYPDDADDGDGGGE